MGGSQWIAALPLVCCADAGRAARKLQPQARRNHKDQLRLPREKAELVGDRDVAGTAQGLEDPVTG